MADTDMPDAGQAAPRPDRLALLEKANASAPWIEKYRPKSIDEVVAHKDIVDTSAQATRAR
jgi:hypothetical protein